MSLSGRLCCKSLFALVIKIFPGFSRVKSGMPSVHPLTGVELRALRRLQRERAGVLRFHF